MMMYTKLIFFCLVMQMIPENSGEDPQQDPQPPDDFEDERGALTAAVQVDARGVQAGAVKVSRKKTARSEKKIVHRHRSLSTDSTRQSTGETFRMGWSELQFIRNAGWGRCDEFDEKKEKDTECYSHYVVQGRVAGALLAMACYKGDVTNCPWSHTFEELRKINVTRAIKNSTTGATIKKLVFDADDDAEAYVKGVFGEDAEVGEVEDILPNDDGQFQKPDIEVLMSVSDYGGTAQNEEVGKAIADEMLDATGTGVKLLREFNSSALAQPPLRLMGKPKTFLNGLLSETDMAAPPAVVIGPCSSSMEAAFFEEVTSVFDTDDLSASVMENGNTARQLKFYADELDPQKLTCPMYEQRMALNDNKKITVIISKGAGGLVLRNMLDGCAAVDQIPYDWEDAGTMTAEEFFMGAANVEKLKQATWISMPGIFMYLKMLLRHLAGPELEGKLPDLGLLEISQTECLNELNKDGGAVSDKYKEFLNTTQIKVLCPEVSPSNPLLEMPEFAQKLWEVDQQMVKAGQMSKDRSLSWPGGVQKGWSGKVASLIQASHWYRALTQLFDAVSRGHTGKEEVLAEFSRKRKMWNKPSFDETLYVTDNVGKKPKKAGAVQAKLIFECPANPNQGEDQIQPLACTCTCKNCGADTDFQGGTNCPAS